MLLAGGYALLATWVGIALVLVIAALRDFASRSIPNCVPITLALLGLLANSLKGSLTLAMGAGVIVFVLAALCWRRGWVGGGDVKLIGAAALTVTPGVLPEFISAIVLAGGCLSLLYLCATRAVPRPGAFRRSGGILRILRVEQWRIHRGCPLPYACAIAAGTIYVHF